MGYHATTVTPANIAPSAVAALPSIRILPVGPVHPLHDVRVLLGQHGLGEFIAGAHRAQVQLRRLHFLGELLAHRGLQRLHLDGKQLRRTPT